MQTFLYFRTMNWKRILVLAVLPFACTKPTVFNGNNTATFNSNLQTQANDQVRISTEIDAAFNDIDSVLAQIALPTPASLCAGNVTVDSVDTPRVITLAYNGDLCGLLVYDSGYISISYNPGTNWSSPVDTVSVTFNNVIINRLSDTTEIGLSGTAYYTNVSGGSLIGFSGTSPPIVHTITGINLGIVFDHALTATWQIARQRNYTYNNGLSISTSGFDTAGGFSNVSEWGGNRFGNSVVTSITSPLVISQGCNWQLTGGQELLNNPVGVTTLSFGLDSTGAAMGCPAPGSSYYFGLSWTGTGENNYSIYLPY
jgi:hypothetical protein